MEEQDDTRLDSFLRDKLGSYRPAPSEAVWAGIETRLGAAAPTPPLARGGGAWLPAAFTGLVGVLVGWWLPHPAEVVGAAGPVAVVAEAPAGPRERHTPPAVAAPAAPGDGVAPVVVNKTYEVGKTYRSHKTYKSYKSVKSYEPLMTDESHKPAFREAALPPALLPLLAAETSAQAAAAADSTAARRRTRLTQKRELARLLRRADSLLAQLSLGAEATVAAPPADSATPNPAAEAPRAVVVRREPRLTQRWRLTAAAGPEHVNWRAANRPGRVETGRAGMSAALSGEYLLNEAVSLSAGVGYTRIRTEVRGEAVGSLDGRVSGFATDYRFLTVPVQVRVRLTPLSRSTRCWADVAVGAQAQWFVGGTMIRSGATPDPVPPFGSWLVAEKVGAGAGPFGGPTVALTSALGLNYALAPRLTARVAPSLRWQPRYLTAAGTQLGLIWAL